MSVAPEVLKAQAAFIRADSRKKKKVLLPWSKNTEAKI